MSKGKAAARKREGSGDEPPAATRQSSKAKATDAAPQKNTQNKYMFRWPADPLTAEAARLKVGGYWKEVCYQMLIATGFHKWSVEPLGDCSFIAHAAGHEIPTMEMAAKVPSADRERLITKGFRKNGVNLLATGYINDTQLFQADELEAIAKKLGVPPTNRRDQARTHSPHPPPPRAQVGLRACQQAVKSRLKLWLTAKEWGTNNVAMLAAASFITDRQVVCILQGRMQPLHIINQRGEDGKLVLATDDLPNCMDECAATAPPTSPNTASS